jgi:hypothetical protein
MLCEPRTAECFGFWRGPKCTGIRGIIEITDQDYIYGTAKYENIRIQDEDDRDAF